MQTVREVEKIIKALANRRRLAILKYLRRVNRATVGSVAEEIKLSFKATSKHLGVLSAAGLVESEKIGLRVDYYLKEPLHRTTKSALESF